MGLTASCVATIGKKSGPVFAMLEPTELILRSTGAPGGLDLRLPLAGLPAPEIQGGVLKFETPTGSVSLHLGKPEAERWAPKIRYPRDRGQKLGLKPGLRAKVLGLEDPGFEAELAAAEVAVVGARTRSQLDLIFLKCTAEAELAQLAKLQVQIQPAGTIWVLWPKGKKALTETHVRAAALALDLVDVKVVSFSEELSGLKLVIRKERRPPSLRDL